MAKTKLRLDELLVQRGLFPTKTKAQAALMAGRVRLEKGAAAKAGMRVDPDLPVEIVGDGCPYVSRGGIKLEAALKRFQILSGGRWCLDVGSSTGGFTDCLLQNGAELVYCVDVGRSQLDQKLRNDPRVVVMEQTNARHLDPAAFKRRPDLATIDVSFVSLTKVLPAVMRCLRTPFEVVALVKPQFELGPRKAPKGVVRKEEDRMEAVDIVRRSLAGTGAREVGLLPSPILGPKGNQEYLLFLRKGED